MEASAVPMVKVVVAEVEFAMVEPVPETDQFENLCVTSGVAEMVNTVPVATLVVPVTIP